MQNLTEENLRDELVRILYSKPDREKMLQSYDEIIRLLGESGVSGRFAKMMVADLKQN